MSVFLYQMWCGNGKPFNKSLYPTPGTMPPFSCTPEILSADINDGVPVARVEAVPYNNGPFWFGHFACTAD